MQLFNFGGNSEPDPFEEQMRPPVGETPAQAAARMQREMEAQSVSDRIDEQIKKDRAALRKEKYVIKLLLLGQSESGKSTTLKNFRMRYARTQWDRERHCWRSVIQLNVIRSIITVLNVVDAEIRGESPPESEHDWEENGSSHSPPNYDHRSPMSSPEPEPLDGEDPEPKFTDFHQRLMIRLSALKAVESELKRRLGPGSDPVRPAPHLGATPFDLPTDPASARIPAYEFAVRSWQEVLDQMGGVGPTSTPDSATVALSRCREDMKTLWEDKAVRWALRRRRLRLPDSAGFFLNDLDRIATPNYVVTDDDIVRARLRTVGIQEHRLILDNGPWDNPLAQEGKWEWRIYDVGGCRTSRHAWLPFFEGVNVIIFVSPISVFDQRLEEDPRVNRLEDSIALWGSICASKLLTKTNIILFLNKCDLLRRKLKRGIKVVDYLPSYGKRSNDILTVVRYFRDKFRDVQKENSPSGRKMSYIFPTTVTDTKATAKTLDTVKDGVLRENLASSQLI